jgi:radical SAM protein with 4Fe4S-binding SPASM domain
MRLLKDAHRDENLANVMCRSLISIDWQGYVYDCDFNQMLRMPLGGMRRHVTEIDPARLEGQLIATADHCHGCTAGCGSSCGGALNEN